MHWSGMRPSRFICSRSFMCWSTETSVLAAVKPDAATAGTPMPGKVESPQQRRPGILATPARAAPRRAGQREPGPHHSTQSVGAAGDARGGHRRALAPGPGNMFLPAAQAGP
mgnify:CR=1 FL=1